MRYATLTTGSITNTATLTTQYVATPDDNFQRLLRRFWASPQTAGILYVVRLAGYQVAQIPGDRLAAGNWPVDINQMFPPLILFWVDIVNNSGGSITPTLMCGYDPVGGSTTPTGYQQPTPSGILQSS